MKRNRALLLVIAALAVCTMFACSSMKARCVNCGKVVKVTTLRGVQFDFNKSTIKPDGEKILAEDVTMLKNDKSLVVSVEGHCDIVGSDDYNQKLSEKRAQSVADFLEKQGVEKSRLKIVGFGRKKPVVPNDTDANRALNRRVEMIIIQGPAAK